MPSLRVFSVLWGTFCLSWGFFSSRLPLPGWGALILGLFSLLALRERWERFPRLAFLLAFSLAIFGVLGNGQGGWMMMGVLGYVTFYYISFRLATARRALWREGQQHARLGAVHGMTFLLATLFSWLEGSLSLIWYLAWASDFLALLYFSRREREKGE
uniref:Uncharacterized protein n=1 Tax=uncultured Chloroflexota bacterium TaxID=166587 RepID=H5SFN5_9CHLR|nr:hypothetical protein HGMM_F22C05C17 [uncultured Chloroflexota bacterium]